MKVDFETFNHLFWRCLGNLSSVITTEYVVHKVYQPLTSSSQMLYLQQSDSKLQLFLALKSCKSLMYSAMCIILFFLLKLNQASLNNHSTRVGMLWIPFTCLLFQGWCINRKACFLIKMVFVKVIVCNYY